MADGSAPGYLSLRDRIEALISGGKFAIGERLPSERRLLETFPVARNTLREALHLLESAHPAAEAVAVASRLQALDSSSSLASCC